LTHLARHVDGLVYRDCGEVAVKGIVRPLQVYQVGLEGEIPKARRRLAADAPKDGNAEAAMVTGLVGGSFGFAGVLGDRLFDAHLPIAPLVFGIVFALMACIASRGLARGSADSGGVIVMISAVALVLALGWWGAPAAVMLLIAGGMGFALGRGR
jgi:hypothetical protein